MGQSESSSAASAGAIVEPLPRAGYRILSVEPNSPAAAITVFPDPLAARTGFRTAVVGQLIVYLDVITSVNGILLDADAVEADVLTNEVTSNVGKPIILEVYNIKSSRFRTVQVTPSASWGGEGLMGVQVRWDALEDASVPADSVLHVVGVEAGSPAEKAGLVAERDYILGSVRTNFNTIEGFTDYLSAMPDEDVQLYVLRVDTDSVHIVSVRISDDPWGPERQTGIGLELAVGHVHEMPLRITQGVNAFALRAAVAEAVAVRGGSAPAGSAAAAAESATAADAAALASGEPATAAAAAGGAPGAAAVATFGMHAAPAASFPLLTSATESAAAAATPTVAHGSADGGIDSGSVAPHVQGGAPHYGGAPPAAFGHSSTPALSTQPSQPPHAYPAAAAPPAAPRGSSSSPMPSAAAPLHSGASPARANFPLAAPAGVPAFHAPPEPAQSHGGVAFGAPVRPATTISSPFASSALPTFPSTLPSAAGSRFRHPQYAQPAAK